MYSNEIRKILERNPITQRYFIGCYAADKIPNRYPLYPHCFILNLDCSGWAGSHWVAVFVISETSVEYYDSLGHWPPLSPYIGAFLQQFATIEYNREQIQSDRSASCGKHAIYFLHRRCSGDILSIRDMVNKFKKCRQHPDLMVNRYVRELMQINK